MMRMCLSTYRCNFLKVYKCLTNESPKEVNDLQHLNEVAPKRPDLVKPTYIYSVCAVREN